MSDAVRIALECGKTVEGWHDSEVAKKLRTRARQLHSDIYFTGTAYVVALTAARSGARNGRPCIMHGLDADSCGEAVRRAMECAEGVEGKSYAAYGAALLYALKSLGLVQRRDSLSALLDDLMSAGASVDEEAARFAEWFKRIVEAVVEER